MKKILYIALFFSVFMTIGFSSCNLKKEENKLNIALQLAEKNKVELQKVLDHYQEPKDSLKLKAAKFLISNMPYHFWLDYGEEYDKVFKKAGVLREKHASFFENDKKKVLTNKKLTAEVKERKINILNKKISKKIFDSFSKEINFLNGTVPEKPTTVFDVKFIDAAYLIENIEFAFKVYDANSLKLDENFLEFVLPYRVLKEPLERGKRVALYNTYSWVRDSIKVQPIEEVVQELYYQLSLSTYTFNNNNYPFPGVPSLSQIEATRFGNCEYLATYFVSVLRSVGIPSGIDYSKRWGNFYKNNSHSWLFYFEGNTLKTFNIGGGDALIELYHQSNITKVYRQTYSKPEKNDVTDLYHDVADVLIDLLWDIKKASQNKIYLGVFNPKTGWDKIAIADKIAHHTVLFKKVGVNLIYAVFYEDNEGKHLVNYPFELDKQGGIRYLDPNKSILEKGTVLRKYPIISYINDKERLLAIQSINGCKLQGKNHQNSDFKDLYHIKDFSSTHEIILRLEHPVSYKYYRFLHPSNKNTKIATFNLLDTLVEPIKDYASVTFKNDTLNSRYAKLVDDNPLTYLDANWFRINYSFTKPTRVSGIKIQAKNDDNHINKDEFYELLYWDKEWLSLGEKKAKDTVLVYKNIPQNALYWLKNTTKGNEEFVFKFNKKGEQVWVGMGSF
ncbi:transglutaminase domain-containing protein [Flavicella sp.]|uniref:transglutaminase-like domain-containing protein n=1 Tax=Flavicella sp. TaxID=2957742 RepID=UPI00301979BA